MSKPPGWRNESARHSLAARGVRSGYVPPKYRKEGYEVYLNGVYQGFTKDLEEAKVYADQIGGRVVESKNRRKILYSAKGVTSEKSSVGTRVATIVDQWSWNEIMNYLRDTHGRYDHVIFTNPDNGKECLIIPKKFTRESMTDINLIKRNLVY